MKRKEFIFLLMTITVLFAIAFTPGPNSAYSSGISGLASTGCGDCHAQELNTSVQVVIQGIPTEYEASQTYQLTVSVTGGPNGENGGFDLVVDKGVFLNPSQNARVESKREVVHSASDSRFWTVDWVAPSFGSGTVTFYIAGMAADGTTSMDTDLWNIATYTTTEQRAVNSAPTNVEILSDKKSLFIGEEVSLSGTATDIDDDSLIYNWSFGDNSTNVTGQNVKHAYDKAGQFIVILTVDDGHGHVVTEELTISVGERPIAGLDIILTFVLVVVALALIALVMRRVFRDVENK